MNGKVPFTEDQYHRTMTNLRLVIRQFCNPGYVVTHKAADRLYTAMEEATEMAGQLYENFFRQFQHRACIRKICPNSDCHNIYAYFFEDWEFCPKCGTKLETTRDDREIVDRELKEFRKNNREAEIEKYKRILQELEEETI